MSKVVQILQLMQIFWILKLVPHSVVLQCLGSTETQLP
jgi:hypothetical protein